jgi:hypothetical protein
MRSGGFGFRCAEITADARLGLSGPGRNQLKSLSQAADGNDYNQEGIVRWAL